MEIKVGRGVGRHKTSLWKGAAYPSISINEEISWVTGETVTMPDEGAVVGRD